MLSSSEHVVGAEVILDSSVNQPPPATLVIDVTEPTTVQVDAVVQAVHPVGYPSFVRAELVHRTPGTSPDELLAVAVEAAAAADLAVVVVGTNEEIESEGYDRTSLALPGTQDQLVKAALAANPRTIVVVNAGAPVLLPWLDEVPCVLWAWLGGQEWPEALADVLTGVTEPDRPPALDAPRARVRRPGARRGPRRRRRRLPRGRPRGVPLLAPARSYPGGPLRSRPRLDHVGVRRASRSPPGPDGSLLLDVTVRNTGARDGREVVQVYVEPPEASAYERPVRWLGGFSVVHAAAGEHAVVQVRVDAHAFRTWDSAQPGWVTPAGTYPIRVGRSSSDLRLTVDVDVPSPTSA